MAKYPLLGFHFLVEFLAPGGGREFDEISFQEVSGMNVEIGTEELSEGGVNNYSHRLPGKVKFGNLVLKRGLVKDEKMVKWVSDAVENYTFKPLTVHVSLLNADHKALIAWRFFRAWPVKWTTSDFKAQDNAVVIESFELSYQHFTRRRNSPVPWPFK